MVAKKRIIPSLLSANALRLEEEIQQIINCGLSMVHLDIMDNHYVPNLTFGPAVAFQLHKTFPNLKMDVHLMASPVDDLILAFAQAGATRISIHPDACLHLDKSLALIKSLGCQAGLAINPATSTDCLTWCAHHLDFVLVMTVNPGFGGQTLIPEVVPKIQEIHQQYPHLTLCVDGGVQLDNIRQLSLAGADEFVMGSALFQSADYSKTLHLLNQRLSHPLS